MKRNDIFLLLSVIFLGVFLFLFGKITATKGDSVIITLNGESYGEYPLDKDTEININGLNTVKIEDKTVFMLTATCPDHLCIHQGKVRDSSKKIICLPNKITVSVTKKSDIDKVVR